MNGTTHKQAVHTGVQAPPAEEWYPMEWEDPNGDKHTFGETTFSRRFGTSGNLMSGFYRVYEGAPGVHFDPQTKKAVQDYSAPLGDETIIFIDGTAVLTNVSTAERHSVGPGSIVSIPKGLETKWEIDAPFLKTWAVFWNGSQPTKNPPRDLKVNHVNDNPEKWTPYSRANGKGGELVSGELYMIRESGSTGFMISGIWRAGRGIISTNVEPDGRMVNPYIGATGDETMLILEGEVDIIETESGKKHLVRAGDALGLSKGMHVTWVSRAPFTRKFWCITRDEVVE